MRNPYGFTFGADPEVFVFDSDKNPVPAGKFIPGNKKEPFPVDGGAVQRDGLAAEFNIDPSDNYDDFFGNVAKVYRTLKTYIPKDHTLECIPHTTFSAAALEDVHPDDLELGCDPDFNAWTEKENPRPTHEQASGFRTTAGHIHIGFPGGPYEIGDPTHRKNCFDLVRQLDWYVGAWLARKEGAEGAARRALYGKAGACRIKTYGVEYRVPSNYWVTAPKPIKQALWLRIQDAIESMRTNFLPDVFNFANDNLVNFINNPTTNEGFARDFHLPVMERYRR